MFIEPECFKIFFFASKTNQNKKEMWLKRMSWTWTTLYIHLYSYDRGCFTLQTIKGIIYCWSKLLSKHYTEELVMQMCVTDLFIESREQSHKQNNAYHRLNLWRWLSVTNWIWWQDRNREMLFICYTKTNFIIHNSLYAHFAISTRTALLSELSFWICKTF